MMIALLLALIIPAFGAPAAAAPIDKAWLCRAAPAWAVCRTHPPAPPAAMPPGEEEPIEYLPAPLVSVPNRPMPPVADAPAPPVASPPVAEPQPAPKPAPVVVLAKPRPASAKAPPKIRAIERKPVTSGSQHITPAQCAQLRGAISTYGLARVRAGAPMFGYSSASVDWAVAACRI